MEKTIHLGGEVLVNKLTYRPIKRGDLLVFHFPVGDTVIDLPEYQSMRPYYDVIRELGRGDADSGRQIVLSNPDNYPLSIRPVYKREVYLKRCIATAGDTLQIRDEGVYINGRPQAWPQESETYFHVVTNGRPLDEADIKARYGLDITDADEVHPLDNATEFEMLLTWKDREKMLQDGFARKISLLLGDRRQSPWVPGFPVLGLCAGRSSDRESIGDPVTVNAISESRACLLSPWDGRGGQPYGRFPASQGNGSERHLFQEPQIKGSENQDDANVHHKPRPESILKE
jgi:signal peptidase I